MTKKYKPFYQKNGGSHAEYISLHESLIRMEEYNYHSTQLDLNSAASEKDFSFIKQQMRVSDDILYIEKNDSSYGKENEPHITVLYGIKNNSDYFKIQQMLKSFGPIKIKIGEISKFEADDYDVIKMSIESKKLHILHNLLKNKIDNDFSYPDYNPHMTLAYIRKGSCDGLLGPCEWTGYEYEFNNMQFSHKDGYKLHISFH